jgi:uroporphyrin-III C-methyltransferase / precorrin-2 dehydrogenase / sirohydrochlorin ferrochelatase
MNPVYPLMLRMDGRRVVVVGGGEVALRRVSGLIDAAAEVVVVAPRLTPALMTLAERGAVSWIRRGYHRGDLAGAWLAHACTDDPAVNAAVADDAQRQHLWCVRADDARQSPAWTPAVGRHGALTVAVTAGGDPRRAVAVRDRIVAELPTGRLSAPPMRDRQVAGWVALIGAGPGDPELITVRGRRLLAEADVVVSDRLVAGELLADLRPHVRVIDASKQPRGRSVSQDEINDTLISHARAGRFVVRLKGGDPYVFGRGSEELRACAAAGVACMVVPGVSSALAAPGAAGVPVTERGLTQEFTVVSGHVPPGDPRSTVQWELLAGLGGTLVLLMAVENLDAISAVLLRHGRPADTPAMIVQDGTTDAQRVIAGTLTDIAERAREAVIDPPAIVVVGAVAASAIVTPADSNPGQSPGPRPW